MNSTILAGRFGLSAAPVGNDGTNYANGGSYTASSGPMPGSVSTIGQIQNYLTSVNNHANPKALYVISSGDNDLNYSNPLPANYLSNSAIQLANTVAALQAAGARTILVPNSYNSAVYAGPGGNITNSNSAAYATSQSYFSERWADLSAAGVHFIPADLDSLFKYVVHNPTLFGFTAYSVQAANAPAQAFTSPYNSALLAWPLSPAQQEGSLFVDKVHLTTAGQTIEADYEYSLLTAPSEISLLAESVVQDGWARAATIQGQIDLSGIHRGPWGLNAWESTGVCNLQVRNAPGFIDDSGTPYGGTLGIDYQLPNGLILGVAFTMGGQTEAFSTGGNFNQLDEAPSLYVAYAAGPWWGNVVASYDLFQDTISRPVPLGVFTDQNNAGTSGQSLALALRGGGDVSWGRFTTGPVGGFLLQEAHVYGFTESGTSGVTAFSFGSQTRDSFVSQLGWRSSGRSGRVPSVRRGELEPRVCRKGPHGNDLTYLGCGPVVYDGRRPDGLQLGHDFAWRILQVQPERDSPWRGIGDDLQSADDNLWRRVRPECQFLNYPGYAFPIPDCASFEGVFQGQSSISCPRYF